MMLRRVQDQVVAQVYEGKHKSTKAEAELMSRPSARPSATHAHQLWLRLDTSTTSSREY